MVLIKFRFIKPYTLPHMHHALNLVIRIYLNIEITLNDGCAIIIKIAINPNLC